MGSTTDLVTTDPQDLGAPIRVETESLPARVNATAIVDQETLDAAGVLLGDVKALRKVVSATFDPHVARANVAHKELTKTRTEHDAPLAQMERAIKLKIGTYAEAEEKRRRIETAKAQAAARKADEERRLEEAAALEDAGEPEAAEEVLVEAPAPPPPARVEKVRTRGVSLGTNWKAEVDDVKKVMKAALSGDNVALAFFLDDKVKAALAARATATAKALKGNMVVAGIRVYAEKGVAAR